MHILNLLNILDCVKETCYFENKWTGFDFLKFNKNLFNFLMKKIIKPIVILIFNSFLGKKFLKIFYYLYYFLYQNKKNLVTIFLFHDVNDFNTKFANEFKLNIKPNSFKKQIDRINKRYNIIHPNDIILNSSLPSNPALITFDDGFDGAFENGIEYLISKNIPCLMFLNMNHIINQTPLISSTICYLSKNSNLFKNLMIQNDVKFPYFLNLDKDLYNKIISTIPEYNIEKIHLYQGRLANYETILKYSDSKYVSYGNHLYEHWNSLVLSELDFEYMINENHKLLSNFNTYINIFAFPNGQPLTCFNKFHIDCLLKFGFSKIFYSSCGVSKNNGIRILDRVILTENETSKFNFYSLLGRSLIFNNNIKNLVK
jgi:hypothetical protein